MPTGGGGGVAVFKNGNGIRSTVYIYDSTISGNTTYGYGGGVATSGGSIFRVNRSLITGNTINAPRDQYDIQGGGGIAFSDISQDATITNSTISYNFTYARGGGLTLIDAPTSNHTKILFSTITGNYGGYHQSSSGMHSAGAVTLNSTIVAGNSNRAEAIDVDGSISASHSLIENAPGAVIVGVGNLTNVDPQLGPLKDNGGPTFTRMPSTTSPVIGAADNSSGIVVDQRGQARPTGAFSAGKDIGAVEKQLIEELIFRNNFEFY